jgi:1-acyl-sn-glycerol-3-phosphate acyltransferase
MRTWFYWPGAWFARRLLDITGGVSLHGVEHVPRDGAYIVVANHCSLWDPAMLGWATAYQRGRIVHFMAKLEMRRWPAIGWLATQSGVFFVRRGEGDRAAQREALALLAAGEPIAIFPEGTRSRDGRLKELKPGAALLALRSGAPLLPVGIAGSHRLFPGGTRIPHRSRITVRIGPTFSIGHQPEGRLDRHALTTGSTRIREAIAALLPPSQRPR